jgi:uncharacterized protein
VTTTYYPRERLGPKMSLRQNGDLLCQDVPIARTGRMLYGYGEIFNDDGVPLEVDGDRTTHVDRLDEDVFRPETIESFRGVTLVDNHPDDDVAPENWRQLAVGFVMNPRRGTGVLDDLILADIVVTHHETIPKVQQGLREVSCGYRAKYEKTGPATYRQHDIVGNHVALVSLGRCGSRCSIGDKNTILTEDCAMSGKEKIKAAFAGKDEAAFDAALADAPKGETISLTTEQLRTLNRLTKDAHKEDCDCAECSGKTKDRTMDARMKKVEDSVADIAKDVKGMKDAFEKKEKEDEEEEEKEKTKDNTALEGTLEMEAPPGTGDKAGKAKDSAFLVDSYDEARSLAEVIAPSHGIQFATLDAKSDPKKTLDSLDKFRRQVLDLAYLQPETHVFMDSVTGGRDYKTFDCNGVRTLFRAVGVHRKTINNKTQQTADGPLHASGGGTGTRVTAIDINKRNADYYAKQQ